MTQGDQGAGLAADALCQATRLKEIHSIALAEILTRSGDFDHWRYYEELNALKMRPLPPVWLEAYAMVCAIGRIRPAKVTGFCKKLREKREKTGDRALFDQFDQRLRDYLHPEVLTNHGYRRASFDGVDHGAVWSHVGGLMAALEAEGFEVFLNSGTLLGVTREGGLIGHDDDVDLAVVLDAGSEEEAAAEWQRLHGWLSERGLTEPAAQKTPEIVKLTTMGEVEVDLFPAWVQEGRAYVYPHTYGDLEAEAVLPLRPCGVTGYKIPREAERMLAVNYGEGWRAPDPLFKFPWAAANARFARFLEAVQ